MFKLKQSPLSDKKLQTGFPFPTNFKLIIDEGKEDSKEELACFCVVSFNKQDSLILYS